ncbi:MAG: tetratricopeptide repeat protein [Chthoniobacterales bacterium]
MPIANAETTDTALEGQVFWFQYRKEIAAVLGLALLAGLAFAGWRFYRERHESAASAAFASAKTTADYQGVIDRYGDTPAAAGAYLLLADEQRKSGKPADANATLQRFLDKFPRHELTSTARMSMAANLEAIGKTDEAAAAYQQIAANDPGSFNAPLALFAQAQLSNAKGRADEARRICETIMSQYSRSYAAMEAGQMLGTLRPTAAPALPAPSASASTNAPAGQQPAASGELTPKP